MTPLDLAKGHLTITDLWRLRNWRGKPGRSCRVPSREDLEPSGSVFANGRLFHDFASGETFDAPGLLARVEGLAAPDACRLFIELANGAPMPARHKPQVPRQQNQRGRIELPPVDFPTRTDLQKLATLRCMSIEACEAAAERKHLFFVIWNRARCWLITDCTRQSAQLRRLDGKKFRRADGETVKALTIRRSCANWPIGASDIENAERVILCEGGGDFLAAYHFAVVEETLDAAQPVVMLGGQRIAPEALARLAGKRVRIFPHLDSAGSAAALRWETQLRAAKIDAHCFDLAGLIRDDDAPVKDLNDVTRIAPDDFEQNRELQTLTIF
jgi:hypothetical protein